MLNRKQLSRARLKVHVVRCRRAAFGTVVDDEISWQGCRKIQHISELVRDTLRAVLLVSNSEMTLDDWKRITVDREVLAKLHTLFLRRQISRTQEARPLRNRLSIHGRRRTGDSMRNVTNEDVEPIDSHLPRRRAREAFDALCELRPCARLPLKQCFDFANHRCIRAWISIVRSQSLYRS